MSLILNKIKAVGVLFSILLISSLSQAGFPCPEDSCNPYNGCMDGCPRIQTMGMAECSGQDASDIQKVKSRAEENVLRLCPKNREHSSGWDFRVSDWILSKDQALKVCTVRAEATFICLNDRF